MTKSFPMHLTKTVIFFTLPNRPSDFCPLKAPAPVLAPTPLRQLHVHPTPTFACWTTHPALLSTHTHTSAPSVCSVRNTRIQYRHTHASPHPSLAPAPFLWHAIALTFLHKGWGGGASQRLHTYQPIQPTMHAHTHTPTHPLHSLYMSVSVYTSKPTPTPPPLISVARVSPDRL